MDIITMVIMINIVVVVLAIKDTITNNFMEFRVDVTVRINVQ